ncbi:MAG: AAA family ATPase [Armatimonadota bacterium]|nr:AAA family ATPase [Armatimonadota bacterium]MDR5703559.1 AAA family ATPase [Armatimonadota bacterium]MDR7434958.1 AAA family ATPase [Armatimonadota bacterium]
MIIAIGGLIATGKSTVASILAERLGLRHISAGEVLREMARRKGVSLLEISRLAEEDHSIDREIDHLQSEMAKAGDAVVESRLCGWMVDADLKVWLRAPLLVRAARVARREGKTREDALQEMLAREASERKRYREIYGIDLDDLSPYDLILDSSRWPPEAIAEALIHLAKTLRRKEDGNGERA